MTTQQLATAWGASEARITRWCRMELLPATRTATGWSIAADARPPWRDGKMIVCWMAATETHVGG